MTNNVHAPSLLPLSPSPPSSSAFTTLVELDVPPPLAKRPRGRPPGSKNKPKPKPKPAMKYTLREREEFPKHVVLNISAGEDIVNVIIEFARNRDVSIVVHDASGALSEATIYNGSHDLSFQGNLQMLTLSGFYTKRLSPSPPKNIPYSYFSIQLVRGSPPQLFGGLVGDKLIAAEPIQVMAFIVKKLDYHMPNVQPVFMGDSLNGITNNAVGPSALSPMKFLAAPTDV